MKKFIQSTGLKIKGLFLKFTPISAPVEIIRLATGEFTFADITDEEKIKRYEEAQRLMKKVNKQNVKTNAERMKELAGIK